MCVCVCVCVKRGRGYRVKHVITCYPWWLVISLLSTRSYTGFLEFYRCKCVGAGFLKQTIYLLCIQTTFTCTPMLSEPLGIKLIKRKAFWRACSFQCSDRVYFQVIIQFVGLRLWSGVFQTGSQSCLNHDQVFLMPKSNQTATETLCECDVNSKGKGSCLLIVSF